MTDLARYSDEELVAELQRRRQVPRCRCGRWQTYLGAYDSDGYTWRCHGCLKAIGRCTCG